MAKGKKDPALKGRERIAGELIALVYIAFIAWVAGATGAFYILFPELGALSHDVFTRPRGAWARAPLMIAITPPLTGAIGIVITRSLPYGFASVLLNVIGGIATILGLGSPVAPAISAGLLPLVLGVTSWGYPLGILFGTALLAILSEAWKRITAGREIALEEETPEEVVHEVAAPVRGRYAKIGALLLFVALAVVAVELTGLRFILFPPLVVIGFEMFVHPDECPWAHRPLMLPVACVLAATAGFLFWRFLGVTPLAAAMSMGAGIIVFRALDLHVPPALAVALLPMVMSHPDWRYPLSVGMGTLMLTLWFLGFERMTVPGAAAVTEAADS